MESSFNVTLSERYSVWERVKSISSGLHHKMREGEVMFLVLLFYVPFYELIVCEWSPLISRHCNVLLFSRVLNLVVSPSSTATLPHHTPWCQPLLGGHKSAADDLDTYECVYILLRCLFLCSCCSSIGKWTRGKLPKLFLYSQLWCSSSPPRCITSWVMNRVFLDRFIFDVGRK